MNFPGSFLVLLLTLGAMGFAVLAVETRALIRSTYYYVAHSCCLILIYVTYAVFAANKYLFIWAGLCLVNTWILPFLQGGLMYTAKRIPAEERIVPGGGTIFAALALVLVALVGTRSSFSLVLSTSPIENLARTVSLNLLAALLLFVYGIIVLITRRHLFKLVLGLLFMTAGAHLTLVQMAPSFFSMVEIEILTKVIATVFAMLYAARLLAERFQSVDADQLLRSDK
jgi:hydrogenase-4 membrane subunit HyfE